MNRYIIFLLFAFLSTSVLASELADSTTKASLKFNHKKKIKSGETNLLSTVIVKIDNLKYRGILVSVDEESLTIIVQKRDQRPEEINIHFENINVIIEVRNGHGIETLSGLMMITGVPVIALGVAWLDLAIRHNNMPDVLSGVVITSTGALLSYAGLLVKRKYYNLEKKWNVST